MNSFLSMWEKVCDILVKAAAPEEILRDALSVEVGTSKDFIRLRCTERLKDYLEQEEILTLIRPYVMGYVRKMKCKNIQYIIK